MVESSQRAPLRATLRSARWWLRSGTVDGALERVRERLELREARDLLAQARAGRDVCWLEPAEELEPLVTVRVATYRRSRLLLERCLPSVLAQTYPRIEVLVVGDCTDDDTEQHVRRLADPRVRFLNLPHPSLYPASPEQRWMVSGGVPMTVGTTLARGSWLAPCDDDDELTPRHVEQLLLPAKANRWEFVHSNTERETAPGRWTVIGSPTLTGGEVTAGAVMYSLGLRFLSYSQSCWRLPEAHDWNLWRRMQALGVVMGHVDEVTYRYHLPEHAR